MLMNEIYTETEIYFKEKIQILRTFQPASYIQTLEGTSNIDPLLERLRHRNDSKPHC